MWRWRGAVYLYSCRAIGNRYFAHQIKLLFQRWQSIRMNDYHAHAPFKNMTKMCLFFLHSLTTLLYLRVWYIYYFSTCILEKGFCHRVGFFFWGGGHSLVVMFEYKFDSFRLHCCGKRVVAAVIINHYNNGASLAVNQLYYSLCVKVIIFKIC